jgi:predicted cupin superfamily sugar epimerase
LAETAESLITRLGLQPHPEGGFFRETWRDRPADGGRGVGTAILFLLRAGEASHWHRVDAVECWHWHAGLPLWLRLSRSIGKRRSWLLAMASTPRRPRSVAPKPSSRRMRAWIHSASASAICTARPWK